MKKLSLFCLFFISVLSYGQELKPYLMFRSGLYATSFSDRGYTLQAEYGKNYEWLDVGLLVDYTTTLPIKSHSAIAGSSESGVVPAVKDGLHVQTAASLSLHLMADGVKMFMKESPHSLKLGGRVGFGHFVDMKESYRSESNNSLQYESRHGFSDFKLDVMYTFSLSEKYGVGVFYETDFSNNAYGLAFRKNF